MAKEKIKVSDYIASFIAKTGISDVFMITGGGAMHLNESFGANPRITYYCNHHEQASAIAAEAYARIKGFGVCIVTTGPGATNALTGVAGAWLDSIPMLVISGQVKRETLKPRKLRQLGIQELDVVEVVKPITKYAMLVERAENICYELEKALSIAKEGRPGPVWIDVPLDVQSSYVDGISLTPYKPKIQKSSSTLPKKVTKALALLMTAKRPVILAGGGIRLSDSQQKFLILAEKLNIPVLTAMSSHDLIHSSHPLFFGRPGAFAGERVGNFIIQNCDVLLSIGARLHLWTIGFDYKNFARGAKKIIVDIDRAELAKPTIKPDLPILSDASDFIDEMLAQSKNVKFPERNEWFFYCTKLKKKYPVVLPIFRKQKKYVNSYYFIEVLSKILMQNDIVVTSDGTALSCTLQAISLKRGQRLISNVGLASMGYGLPAAIGACVANRKKRVICLEGDGSIQMNLQELQTVIHHKLPIKIFVINNDGYLAIRNTQEGYFGGHYVGSDPKSGVSIPDMQKISKAYGMPYIRIKNHFHLKNKLQYVLKTKGPFLCEIMMDPNQPLIPKVTSLVKSDGTLISKPLEDMYPFLPRDEFLKNMIIPALAED